MESHNRNNNHHHDHSAHGHHHDTSVREANAEYFDNIGDYETKFANVVEFVTTQFMSRVDFANKDVLDFACGGGELALKIHSAELGKAKSVTGVDISQGMLEKFHEKVKRDNIDTSNLHIIQITDLEEAVSAGGPLHGKEFDIITCSMAYHHFEDPNKISGIFAKLLRPSGMLVIADMYEHKDDEEAEVPHDIKNVIPHHLGYKEDTIRSIVQGEGEYKATGLTFESWDNAGEIDVVGTMRKIGYAKAASKET